MSTPDTRILPVDPTKMRVSQGQVHLAVPGVAHGTVNARTPRIEWDSVPNAIRAPLFCGASRAPIASSAQMNAVQPPIAHSSLNCDSSTECIAGMSRKRWGDETDWRSADSGSTSTLRRDFPRRHGRFDTEHSSAAASSLPDLCGILDRINAQTNTVPSDTQSYA